MKAVSVQADLVHVVFDLVDLASVVDPYKVGYPVEKHS